MNLDDLPAMQALDSQNMLLHIDNLPGQLARAWSLGQTLPLPAGSGFSRVVLCGMGGSAIGADLLAGYAAALCAVPVVVHRDYGLPAFAQGPETLVVASSHSGDTEETLDAFEEALRRGCTCLAVCTGGKLAAWARAAGCPTWQFDHAGQPRAAVGYSFGLLLALFDRLGLVPEQDELLVAAVAEMQTQQELLRASIPAAENPAKRYAGQLVGRWVTIYGAGLMAVVARRWKTQINELAKAPANFEALPEADHNAMAGVLHPSEELLMPHTLTLFLRAGSDHPRNALRANLTRQTFMLEGLNTDFYMAPGESPLAQMWTALHFGDYLAYYLAVAYSCDPTPVEALAALKASLAGK